MDLSSLNDRQREAVLHTEGPLLVLAGAGSGKTRVLTTSIAYLIREKRVNPYNILAITFTNKAANEMKERIGALLDFDVSSLWIGTFHSICGRILRRNIDKIGYSKDFTIYDTTDQKTLAKEIINDFGYKNDISPKEVLNIIDYCKNKLIGPEEFSELSTYNPKQEAYYQIYKEYEKRKFKYNALDFNDLIEKTLTLFQTDRQTLAYYQEKFEYIYVDEYQDTNRSQYDLIKFLAGPQNNVVVVGDEDQSIYGFRGADINNILDFEKDFKGADLIKLEENYRSTGNILNVANLLIANNTERKEKNLRTAKGKGAPVSYLSTSVESEEAKFVVDEIKSLVNEGYSYGDFAILYRTNAQSRSFEEALMKNLVDYKVIGGLKFYDRKEIKDLVAYLKILVNPSDDISLKRIINEPKRGIGDKSIERLELLAGENGVSMLEMIKNPAYSGKLPDRLKSLTNKFYSPLRELFDKVEDYPIVDLINEVLERSGYLSSLTSSLSVEERSRVDNINEFISAASDYQENNPEDSLFDYLENLSLLSDLDKTDEVEDSVSLMTIHSAKGLEFPVCFIVGMDEGLFPSKMSLDEGGLEEERRLFYVAITRAEEKLYLTGSQVRRTYGQPVYYRPSRFIDEIRGEIEEISQSSQTFVSKAYDKRANEEYMKQKARQAVLKKKKKPLSAQDVDFKIGDKVNHSKWGQGMIVQIKETEDGNELVVAFDKKGLKKLNQAYAPISKVE